MLENQAFTPSDKELLLLARAFSSELEEDDVIDVLEHLNGLTTHRFTGVYRFEPGWVVSVALYDRENPDLRVGADVKMKESYCWLTGVGERPFVIEDALSDIRLSGHVARQEVRSYVAILLRDKQGTPWGTLCHFDFAAKSVPDGTLARLEAFRPLVEEMVVRDGTAQWAPDAPSVRREPRVNETMS